MTSTIAKSQKPATFMNSGLAAPDTRPAMSSSHTPTVTRWKTPTTSSTVVWAARSSSRS